MGTAFTIDIRDNGDWFAAVNAVVSWLHFVDTTFSTFREDSDISRIRRGELDVGSADPHVGEVLALCVRARDITDGYFSPLRDGAIDPTGLVKGWAIDRASTILRDFGSANHAVNGGGDMQLAGEVEPGRPWGVGIADPRNRDRLLDAVDGRDIAVATSGSAERGGHIVDPFTGRSATDVISATVVGAALTDVDTFATAAVAMGSSAPDWLEHQLGVEAMVVLADGTVRRTTGWRRWPEGPPRPRAES